LDRIFLDANVLYSATYLECSRLAPLTTLEDLQLLTSSYAIEEARRNLAEDRPEALPRLNRLVSAVAIVDAPLGVKLPPDVQLDPKDEPHPVGCYSRRIRLSADQRRATLRSSGTESASMVFQ